MLNSRAVRSKDMVIGNFISTYHADFKRYDSKVLQFCYKSPQIPHKKKKLTPKIHIPIDNQSLRPLEEPIPFDLLWKFDPKPILRTRPSDEPKPFGRMEDAGRAHAQATRPRVTISPAVVVDDIDDEEVRDILVKATYASSAHQAMEEALTLAKYNYIKAKWTGYASANPVVLGPAQPPLVSPEWRRETATWDGQQFRAPIDSDYEFWKRQDTYKWCPSCKETSQIAATRKMSKIP